jgi:hypothetical protein
MKKLTFYLLLMACIVFFSPAAFSEPAAPILGQVVATEMTMDGIAVPSGTTLLGDTTLNTGSFPASIHLGSGPVLELDQSSSAYFEKLDDGAVRISIGMGSMSFLGETEVMTVAANEALTIPAGFDPDHHGGSDDDDDADTSAGDDDGGVPGLAIAILTGVGGAVTAIIWAAQSADPPAPSPY